MVLQWKRENERERERSVYERERPLSLYWRKWEKIFVVRKLEDKRGYASSYVREGNCVHMISLVMLHVVPSSLMRKPIFSLFQFSSMTSFFSDRETQDWETTLRGGISFSFSGEVTLQVSEKWVKEKCISMILDTIHKIGKKYLQVL